MKTDSVFQLALRYSAVTSALVLGCVFLSYKSYQGTAATAAPEKVSAPAGDNLANASIPINLPSASKVRRATLMSGSKTLFAPSTYSGTDVESGTLVLDGASSRLANTPPTDTRKPEPRKVPRERLISGSKTGIFVDSLDVPYTTASPLPNARAVNANPAVQGKNSKESPPTEGSKATKRKVIIHSSKSAPVFDEQPPTKLEGPSK